MRYITPVALSLVLLIVGGCGDDSSEGVDAPVMVDGQSLYAEPLADGNTFACGTCHALTEPASDGMRRVGHSIGGAPSRPSFKNGQLDDVKDAVNSCLEEWMNAEPWAEGDPRWEALLGHLEGDATGALSYAVVQPPASTDGGDAAAGESLFNISCATCHGADAVGTERALPLAGRELTGEYIAARVRLSGKANSPVYEGLQGGIMPFWSEDRLSDDELRDLIAYIQGTELPDDNNGGGNNGGEGPDRSRTCDSTHAKVGQVMTFENHFHGIAGRATIMDDCNVLIEDFHFDGNGIEVTVYGAVDADWDAGYSMTGDLFNFPVGYEGATIMAALPEDKTLDDLDGLSVWCGPAGISFGDGFFAAP